MAVPMATSSAQAQPGMPFPSLFMASFLAANAPEIHPLHRFRFPWPLIWSSNFPPQNTRIS